MAHTEGSVKVVCPLDGTTFEALVDFSGTESGQRLDLKPLGPISAPWHLPVCPKCGFVLIKTTLTDAEKATLLPFVASPDYQLWRNEYPSYFLGAKILERLAAPENAIAYAFLQASWQAEPEPEKHRACLSESLVHFQRYLLRCTTRDEAWINAELVCGEILRQIGDFSQAQTWFDRIKTSPEFQDNPQRTILKYQLSLIAQKDASPKEVPEMEVTGADIAKDPIYRIIKGMKGYEAMLHRFELIRWSDNAPQGFQVQVHPKGNSILSNVWWCSPITKDALGVYDWNQFMNVYDQANTAISKHAWLKDWLSSADQGAPSREVLLYMTGIVPRMLDYPGRDDDYGVEAATLLKEWSNAGLTGKPRYEIGLYEGSIVAKLYLADEDSRGLIFYHYPHDPDLSFGPGSHWLDKLDLRAPSYVVVSCDGKWEKKVLAYISY
jgi:tetratricopeptide (TPR) repeat protein